MSSLVQEIKTEAAAEASREVRTDMLRGVTCPQRQQRLLLSGRALADMTTRLVEAAKAAARRPDDVTAQVASFVLFFSVSKRSEQFEKYGC